MDEIPRHHTYHLVVSCLVRHDELDILQRRALADLPVKAAYLVVKWRVTDVDDKVAYLAVEVALQVC